MLNLPTSGPVFIMTTTFPTSSVTSPWDRLGEWKSQARERREIHRRKSGGISSGIWRLEVLTIAAFEAEFEGSLRSNGSKCQRVGDRISNREISKSPKVGELAAGRF